MILEGNPTLAICDHCSARAPTEEVRKPSDGSLMKAFLPEGWQVVRSQIRQLHLCGRCCASVGLGE